MNASPAFLGRGWAYPVQPGPTGALGLRAGADQVAQSIWLILDTDPGERVMRPSFGCGLRRYLMQPNTSATRALIRREVELALGNFEPRIQLTALAVDADADDPALVLVRIGYVTVRDQRPGNLVYPFYLG
jgi:phage baseplate assembly protein W